MKKLVMIALAAIAMVACEKKEDGPKAILTVAAPAQTVVVTPTTLTQAVKVDVVSSEGIEKVLVKIASSSQAFMGALTAVGLAEEFDLRNLNPAQSATLTAVGVTGPAEGAKAWSFVLTPFLTMMYATDTGAGGTGVFTAKFDIKVVDLAGNSKTGVVNLDFKAQ